MPSFQLPRNWKAKVFLALGIAHICFHPGTLESQCLAATQFPVEPVQASSFNDTLVVTTMQSAGQYFVIEELELGQDYIFSADSTDYITVRDVYDNGIVLGHGPNPFTYSTGTGPDIVAVHINLLLPPCGIDSTHRTTTARCLSCPAVPPGVGINIDDPASTLDVEGKIRVGDDALMPEAGMIRWNVTNNDFEGFDGNTWRSLTRAQSIWGTLQPGVVQENEKLIASDGSNGDALGISVSLSGDRAIVGAHQDDDNGGSSGSAYVFHRDGNAWAEEDKIIASDGAPLDRFGVSVAISGDFAIVGAYWDDDNGTNSGSAYIFHRNGGTWNEQIKLTSSDGAAGDYFGFSVAISGDYAIVGAYEDDDDGGGSGSAYLFHRSGSIWIQEDKITASDASADDGFGVSVAISGDYAIVGAYQGEYDGTVTGSAYIFHRNGNVWNEEDKLIASDPLVDDQFGISVSLAGDYAIVGANLDDDNGGSSGSAYLFHRNGTVWTEEDKVTASDASANDRFGRSVSLSGDYAIVGAWYDDDNGANSGSAYLFHRNGTIWIEKAKTTASDGESLDYFGYSVAISGNFAIAGANGDTNSNGNSSGAIYFFHK